MAKSNQRNRPSSKSSSDTDTDTQRSSSKMRSYVVKPGQQVQAGGDQEGEIITYGEGDSVELSEEDAAAIPWAVETEKQPARSGQTSRLKRQIEDMKRKIDELQRDNKALQDQKDDPEFAAAVDSIKGRGDNFIARGEPQIGSVPADVIDSHDRQVLASEFGGKRASLDDVVGGHGFGREQAPDAVESKVAGAHESQPANLKPGETVNPGDTKPRGK